MEISSVKAWGNRHIIFRVLLGNSMAATITQKASPRESASKTESESTSESTTTTRVKK